MKITRAGRAFIAGLMVIAFAVPLAADAAAFSYGSGTTYTSGSSGYPNAVKIDDTHVLVAFENNENGGTAVIGTIDGTTITFGTEYPFAEAARSVDMQLIDSTHALITYATDTDGYAVVATISGTAISYGTPVMFSSSLDTGGKYSVLAVLDSTHFIVEYVSDSGEFPDFVYNTEVIAGTVSGTAITFGSPSTLTTDDSGFYPYARALDATHALLLYGKGDGTAFAIVASVSGTTMTLGSPVEFSDFASDQTSAVLNSTHAVITFRYGGDDKAYSLVATIDGTDVTFGSATAVTDGTTYYTNTEPLSSTTAIFYYRDVADNGVGKARLLTVDAGTVSSDTASEFLAVEGIDQYMDAAALDSSSALILSQTNNTSIIATTDTTAPSAPASFAGTASNGTVSLDWTNPVDSDFLFVTVRRSSTSHPATVSSGSSVLSRSTATSVSDAGLADGTYYYSIFARDLRGNYSTAATATVSVQATSTASQTTSGGGGRRGSPGRGGVAIPLDANRKTPAAPHMAAQARRESMSSDMRARTCDRVMKWFSGNQTMLSRVNARLEKRFGFTCN